MPLTVGLKELPVQIDPGSLASAAYPDAVADVGRGLVRRLSCLVECPKEVAPHVAHAVRTWVQPHGLRCAVIDARAETGDRAPLVSSGLVGNMRAAVARAVAGPQANAVLLLPHLDLLAGGAGALGDARELIALLVENPDLLWVGFRDPAVPLPGLVEQLPLNRVRMGGVPRGRLRHLVTQGEARKFGGDLDLGRLHRVASGLNVVQLRKYLAALDREDRPASAAGAFAAFRALTLSHGLTIPGETLAGVGGYEHAKRKLREELLDVFDLADAAATEEARDRLDALAPRGVLLVGPPGVGKRLFARALANAAGGVFLETTGAELKSRYLGGSEENLRLLFARARAAAPAVILFKELDAFAARPARGAAEPSLFLQLIQELDALPACERVVPVATAPTAGALDPAVVQPGRFELVIELQPPSPADVPAVLEHLAPPLGLEFSPEAAARAVELVEAYPSAGPPHHCARLAALCRVLARSRARSGASGPVAPLEVTRAWWGL
ncbi:atp-dependent metalloprotease : Cell division protein FtsH OS=Cystobacter fuscus DSM 2262 GN=D187_003964 PE=4 SV=1: AAA [Gemmataceae bacterium]|nr:atp-dependent metalloprotease : Cell division protein FtsH OS=Cystobacter fuscus DSM 2262 GN=D187_003964 PE=4 SV=1: AAA [Gemmataceae bacterium]VTU01769.1 atp-dependent metalloprotease : Cell division protein FtsH OS=Cystobacter fuscus DSM 2262 GN=D187_003964 PE=4 SV=1: AAA [Gemmataceae bacterium]